MKEEDTTMSEACGDGGPFFFAAERPPSKRVGINFSTETATQLIAALNGAVGIAAKDSEASPPH
jgi:hypothetical protein